MLTFGGAVEGRLTKLIKRVRLMSLLEKSLALIDVAASWSRPRSYEMLKSSNCRGMFIKLRG